MVHSEGCDGIFNVLSEEYDFALEMSAMNLRMFISAFDDMNTNVVDVILCPHEVW
jgi:hypothetical protein